MSPEPVLPNDADAPSPLTPPAAAAAAIGGVPLLDARRLRELGEHADGFRDEDLVIVAQPVGGKTDVRVLPVTEANAAVESGEATPLLRVHTPARIKDRVVPEIKVFVGGKEARLPEHFDALFWTESAIEKFLFPYYEQLRIFEVDFLDDLKKAYFNPETGKRIIAFAHIPPSRPQIVNDPRARDRVKILVDRHEEGVDDELMSVDDFLDYIKKILASAKGGGFDPSVSGGSQPGTP